MLRLALAWLVAVAGAPAVAPAVPADPPGDTRTEAAAGDRMRKFAVHLESSAERERTALARELHDEFGSVFTALSLNCNQALQDLPPESVAARERLLEMNGLIGRAMDSMQRLLADLRPQVLDDLGLNAALASEVRAFGARTGIESSLRVPEDEPELAPERARALFRVVQEALTNVARHAQATRVSVSLERAGSDLVLEVRDDGRGIARDRITDPGSYGILGMQERVELLGGRFDIQGSPGRGTRVRAVLPSA